MEYWPSTVQFHVLCWYWCPVLVGLADDMSIFARVTSRQIPGVQGVPGVATSELPQGYLRGNYQYPVLRASNLVLHSLLWYLASNDESTKHTMEHLAGGQYCTRWPELWVEPVPWGGTNALISTAIVPQSTSWNLWLLKHNHLQHNQCKEQK